MNAGSVIALAILYFTLMQSRLSSIESQLKKVKKLLRNKDLGLPYDGLAFPDGPVPELNLVRYHAALVEHEGGTAGWLEVNLHQPEPKRSRRDNVGFWCREHYATVCGWMLSLLGCAVGFWLMAFVWPVVVRILLGEAYDPSTGAVVPHHTPQLVILLAVAFSLSVLAMGTVLLVMEYKGRMTDTMTKWCEWKTREDNICWHEAKLAAVRAALPGVEQDVAELKALRQAS